MWLSQRKSVLAFPLVANGSIAKGEAWDQDDGNKVFFVLILHSLYFLCNFYLLLAALGLCGCAGFSLVRRAGATLSLRLSRLRRLSGELASAVAAPRLESTDSIIVAYGLSLASPMAQTIKTHLPMQEIRVRFLGQEDPLEKGMATHSRILAWRIPWTEEPGGWGAQQATSMGSQRAGHD